MATQPQEWFSKGDTPSRWRQDKEVNELIEYFEDSRFTDQPNKAAAWAMMSAEEIKLIEKELVLCRNDFIYAARNYFWISTKQLNDQLFNLWPAQELILEKILELKSKGLIQKIVIIKSRQLGCSTLIEALVAWRTMFFQNVNGLVVSYDDQHAGEVLFPIMQFIYDRLPWWLQPAVASRKYNKGIFFENPNIASRGVDPGLNSRIFVKSANALGGVGQGIRLSAVHCSEWADWDERQAKKIIDEDMGNALVEDAGTFAILESTAKGANNYSHRMWKKNIEKAENCEWHPIFLPWFFETSHVRALHPGFKLDKTDLAMRDRIQNDWVRCDSCEQYHYRFVKCLDRDNDPCPTCKVGTLHPYVLPDEKLAWMQHRRVNAEKDDESRKLLLQEQCSTGEEAFQVTGYKMFPDSAQEWANSTVRDPIAVGRFDRQGNFHGFMTAEKPREDGSRRCPCAGCAADHQYDTLPLQIWAWPKPGVVYCVGADVAEGLGGEAHFSVGSCISYSLVGGGDEQVAVWRSNTTDPIEFAAHLNHLGRMYNDALMSVECNRFDICLGTLRTVFNYPTIYRWKHIDSMNILSQKLGWWTNLASRPRLWQTFRRWLQSQLFYARSRNLVEEMKNFVKDEEDATMAGGDNKENDDEVLATMIALFTAHEGDWNDALGYIPTRSAVADADTDWEMTCRGCGAKWPAVTPGDYQRCKECGSRMLEGARKVDANAPVPQNPGYDLVKDEWDEVQPVPAYEEL
jgi:hypothetical protein